VKRVRANRVILSIAAVLAVLLVLGAAAAVQDVRSIGWSPGASTIHVIGNAMVPTVADNDYLIAQPYRESSPRAGDIVVMRDPFDHSRDFLKRVIAGPGQTILIREGTVLADGSPLAEPYVNPEPWTGPAEWPLDGRPLTLGSDEYFVLGDNRNHSTDSRTFGPISRDDIKARAVHIVLPSARARSL
jgi:signal peptidase I